MPAEDEFPHFSPLPSEDLATGLEPAAGRLLVASPMLVDPNFARTVVLLLDVDDNGALGVVLNRPGEVEVPDVLEVWRDVVDPPAVLFDGGPVSPDSALGVATIPATAAEQDTQPVGWRAMFEEGGLVCGLVDLDAPVELVRPALASLRIYAGYAGWTGGQLEDEIELGGWFVVPGSASDATSPRAGGLWGEALRRQGGSLAWVAAYPADPTTN